MHAFTFLNLMVGILLGIYLEQNHETSRHRGEQTAASIDRVHKTDRLPRL